MYLLYFKFVDTVFLLCGADMILKPVGGELALRIMSRIVTFQSKQNWSNMINHYLSHIVLSMIQTTLPHDVFFMTIKDKTGDIQTSKTDQTNLETT